MTFVKEFIQKADDWFLYPVYTLSAQGKWTAAGGRIVLLGDSAHAMPPQGESSGYAIENTILYARMLGEALQNGDKVQMDHARVAHRYETKRRPKINAAFVEAHRRWSGAEKSSWISYKLKTWLLPVAIWFFASKTRADWQEDLAVGALD